MKRGSSVVITSNRDEQYHRPTIPPRTYERNGIKLLYPKDEKAGGTWIAASESGRVCNLLNGAKETDEHREPYPGQKSRGVVVLEAFEFNDPRDFFHHVDLNNVEPFTLLIFDTQDGQIFEIKWDREHQTFQHIKADQDHIWSSPTLYSRKVRIDRENRFHSNGTKDPGTPEALMKFHDQEQMNDPEKEKEHGLKTVSTTQVILTENQLEMSYLNRVDNQRSKEVLMRS